MPLLCCFFFHWDAGKQPSYQHWFHPGIDRLIIVCKAFAGYFPRFALWRFFEQRSSWRQA
jgi:hypothetical protein